MTIVDEATKAEQVMYYAYDANGQLLSLTYGEDVYYYILNLQGDVVGITDSEGTRLISYRYEAYGSGVYVSHDVEKAALLAQISPFGYRSYVMDTGTAMYYLQSRYYDPTLGRFLNADAFASTGQGLLGNNMFAYCLNNPVIYNDLSGYFVFTAIGAIVGAACGALDALITGKQGKDFVASVVGAAVTGAISGAATDVLMITGGTAGVVIGIMACAGALGGATGNLVETWIADKPINGRELAVDTISGGVFGGLFGLMNGPISSARSLIAQKGYVWFLSRTLKKELASGIVEEFLSNVVSDLGVFLYEMLKDAVKNTFSE